MTDKHTEELSSFTVSTVLFLLSFGTVLFTVILFRLLSFFIMPSLFFDLLFIGFPIGALVGFYLFKTKISSLSKSLWLLQLAMLFSVGTMFICKQYDYLRAHLFDIELTQLFLQIVIFTVFFLPFFVAYGLSEYIGYQIGRRVVKGKMYVVYALYLFGAALGYLFAEFFFTPLGIVPMMIIPFLCVALAALLLKSSRFPLILVECALLLGLVFVPGLDSTFLKLYKGDSFQSTQYFEQYGYEIIHQEWGKYGLVEIMEARSGVENYAGFYNDIFQWDYSPEYGYAQHGMGMIPLDISAEDAKIVIIGSGGGRQVQYAKKTKKDLDLLAIELEPGVLDAVQHDLAEQFNSVYDGPNVKLVNAEARGYIENLEERFDLIYLPSVGGYPQMMLEPGNMIRTIDAFETLASKLTDDGILAVWYPIGLDPKQILTEQYMRTFESENINLNVVAYSTDEEILILGSKNAESLPLTDEVQKFFTYGYEHKTPLSPNIMKRPQPIEKTWGTDVFKPITDNQPFLAGNVQHIFSLEQVGRLFLMVAGLLVLFSGLLLFALRGKKDSNIPGKTFGQTLWISLLVGANFLIVEHYLILMLFKKTFVYHNALVLGAIGFLIVSGLGSTFITAKRRPLLQLIAGITMLLLLFLHNDLPVWASLLLLAPASFVTGSFFPVLFEAAAKKPLVVFAADAIGAALGLLVSFFVPIVFGFSLFFVVSTLVFIITLIVTYRFFQDLTMPPEHEIAH